MDSCAAAHGILLCLRSFPSPLLPRIYPPAGVVRMREVDTDFDHDSDVRVLLLVHDTKPPFLDGRFLFTKQRGEWA